MGNEGIFLGFDIDTELGSISAPLPKIEEATNYSISGDVAVGIQHVSLKAMHTLRGYMQHWLIASMFWASCVQPVDLLLTYGSEDCSAISFPNFHIWTGYWGMMSLLQTLARYEKLRPSLFRNSHSATLALRRRFSGRWS